MKMFTLLFSSVCLHAQTRQPMRGGAAASVVLLRNVRVKKWELEEGLSPLEHLQLFSKLI